MSTIARELGITALEAPPSSNTYIVEYRDDFDLRAWTRMALGPTGALLVWSQPIQNKVRATAMASLQKFMAAHPECES